AFPDQTKDLAVCLGVSARSCEIIKCPVGSLNNVTSNKQCPFPRSLFTTLQAAFPFEDGPSGKIIFREFGKNCSNLNLTITERTEAACARDPRLVSAVHSLATVWPELSVLHVKHFDPLVIKIDEL